MVGAAHDVQRICICAHCICAMEHMTPRVAALLPSATEIVCAVGGAHLLVARSHECDYPEKIVESLPSITGAANGQFTTSREVHDATCQAVQDGRSIYSVNVETLKVRSWGCSTVTICCPWP